MTIINLNTTKQSKQISNLKIQLEKRGWKIIKEQAREFKGKLKWEIKDDIPNLIYTWTIQRNPANHPKEIDFIAHWDDMTYETQINDCSHCMLRGTRFLLNFVKDKSLKNESNRISWEEEEYAFVNNLEE